MTAWKGTPSVLTHYRVMKPDKPAGKDDLSWSSSRTHPLADMFVSSSSSKELKLNLKLRLLPVLELQYK